MSDILTGARTAFYVNGQKIGYATQVSVSQEDQVEPFEPLDSIEPEELVVVGRRTTVECGFVRALNKPATKDGMFFTAAQLKGGGVDLNIKIVDTVSKTVLYNIVGCKPTGRNTQFPARGMATKNMTFLGKSAIDENTQAEDA